MAVATFHHGDYQTVNYAHDSAVSAGDVIVVGILTLVTHRDLAADEMGGWAVSGGWYTMTKAAGSGSAIAAGTKVYYDASPAGAAAASSGNTAFGYAGPDGASDDDTEVLVLHTCP